MDLGNNISLARKACGLTQEQLAEKMGVSFQAVSSWERNESMPDIKKLLRLSSVLHLSLNALFAGDGDDWKLKITDHQPLLEKAIEFAAVKHAGAQRKGSSIPYITHVMEAMEIVSRLTQDESIRAAAVLHDTLEDTATNREELEQNFGQRVAALVAGESENKRAQLPAGSTWKTRKQETIDHLNRADTAALIIALGDKLSNLRAMERDHRLLGEQLWQRFNVQDPRLHRWYYCAIAEALKKDPVIECSDAFEELLYLIDRVFGEYREKKSEDETAPTEETALPLIYCYRGELPALLQGDPPSCVIIDQTDDPDLFQLQRMLLVIHALMAGSHPGLSGLYLQLCVDPDGEVFCEETDTGYALHLTVQDGWHWCQSAYQLGYLLMRCLIDQLGKGKPVITWAEELISEAVAIKLLELLMKSWQKTPFSTEDPVYDSCIAEYIDHLMQDEGTCALQRCKGREELALLNDHNSFDDRLDESHILFRAMEAQDLYLLADVREYAKDGLLLHNRLWCIQQKGSSAVRTLCRLQKNIPGCDIPCGIENRIDLEGCTPSEAHKQAFGSLIRALEALPCEYIRFDFMKPDPRKEQIGVNSFRLNRLRDGRLMGLLVMETEQGRKAYSIGFTDDDAVLFLRLLLEAPSLPPLDAWLDVTEDFFHQEPM